MNSNSTNALDFEETYNYILYTQKTPPLKKMKNHFWIFFVVYLTIHSASFVRSEYTWNGSEWVWTDSENEVNLYAKKSVKIFFVKLIYILHFCIYFTKIS